MDGRDADFLKTVSMLGCEVHRFDPSNPNASAGHLGNSLDGNHGDRGVVNQHKMWLVWRAPRKHKARGNLGSVSQTLSDIMAALGHPTVRHTHTHTEQLLCVFVYRNVKKKNTLKEARLLCVSMATGLFAISGCHGNSFSERIAEWLSYILQPQEGTACPQFDYMLFRLSHNFQYFSKKNTTYNWQHCHKVVVVGGFFVLFFCMFSHYFTGFHLVQRHVHWGLG